MDRKTQSHGWVCGMICLPCAIAKKVRLIKESMMHGICEHCNRMRVVGEVQK